MPQPVLSTIPDRRFKDHEAAVTAVAVLPDRQCMVTSSKDKRVRLWDLKTGVVLKKMLGHRNEVLSLAVSRDGQLIASGDDKGELIVWHGETLPQCIQAHSSQINALDFSPDGTVLATGSGDSTTKLWNTKTWLLEGNPIQCGSNSIHCVRYSPSGELLAIATASNTEIYDPYTRRQVAQFGGDTQSLVWTPDATRLLSAGLGSNINYYRHRVGSSQGARVSGIREWDALTWKQVGDPLTDHTHCIKAIAIHPAGTLVASASHDDHVYLWSRSDRRIIATFQHSSVVECLTFSMDGKHILSGEDNKKVSEWEVPEDALPEDVEQAQCSDLKILATDTTVRNACVTGDLTTAEKLLTQEIDADANNYTSYANRSFVMARQLDWDRALHDASKSVSIQPSLTAYVSKGIAFCGKQQARNAMTAFDLAFTSADGNSKTIQIIFLLKAIALFNANYHEEAMLFVQELAARPSADPLASRVVEAYFRFQLGIIAMNSSLYKEAVDHFAAAVNAGAFFSKLNIHSLYEDFVVLFGWDLKSLWQNSNQQLCHALNRGGQFGAALESYRYMMDLSDELTKVNFLAWIPALNEEWRVLNVVNENLASNDYSCILKHGN